MLFKAKTNAINQSNTSLFWIFYLIFTLIEFYFFKQYVYQDIIPFYPQGFDQASYLPLLYQTYENIKQYGLINGFAHSQTLVTGLLFPAQTVAFFFLFGASRFSALLVNFIYFIALQIICLLTLNSLTKKHYFLFLFLGLLLLIDTTYLKAGGNLFDIRMDFIAFCLYGIFICFTIKSNFFLDRKYSLITAFIACFLILLRTLTLVYICGTIGLLFLFLLVESYLKKETISANQIRLKNILLVGFLICAMTLPFIWLSYEGLYNYYMVGHVLGEEKYIRADLSGITDLFSLLIYYPNLLLFHHIGSRALVISLVFLLLFSWLNFYGRKKIQITETSCWRLGFAFLASAILVPLIVLTLDLSKSPVVPGIMVVPSLWLLIWYGLYVTDKRVISPQLERCLKGTAILVLLFGCIIQGHILHKYRSPDKQQDQLVIRQMYLDIGNFAVAKEWSSFQIAFDQLTDYFSAGGIAALYYEKTGRLLTVNVEKLGGTIFTISKEEALTSLERASVLIINTNPLQKMTAFPFNKTVVELKPMIDKYADEYFSLLAEYQFYESTYKVYVRLGR